MEVLTRMTVLFTLVLAFSLVIERLMEVLKSFYDLLDSHLNLCNFWTEQTKKIQKKLNARLKTMEFLDPAQIANFTNKLDVLLVSNRYYPNHTVPVLSGDLVRAGFIKCIIKGIGVILGIVIAVLFDLNFLMVLGKDYPVLLPLNLQTILSGAIIGLGSTPVHKVILYLERRRERKMATPGGVQ